MSKANFDHSVEPLSRFVRSRMMDKFSVKKFDGKQDFQVWKVQVESFLVSKDLFRPISGTIDSTHSKFERTDAKARAVILNSVETSVVRAIMPMKTSKEMWERMNMLYESRSKISVGILLQEFHSYKMTDEMSMAEHIAKVDMMHTRLLDLGKVIDESEVVDKLLQLPKRYRHLVSAWDNLDEAKQTKENLIPRLLKEEVLEKGTPDSAPLEKEKKKKESSVAFSASKKEPEQKKFTGLCHYCRKPGHMKNQCRKLQAKNNPSHQQHEGKGQGQSQANVVDPTSQQSYLFSAPCASQFADDWLADTGAGRHMCNRKDWFSEYAPLSQKQPIHSASGHIIYAIGVGTIPLESFVDGKCIPCLLTEVLHIPDVKQNLISIGKLTDKGFEARFTSRDLKVWRDGKVVAEGTRKPNGCELSEK